MTAIGNSWFWMSETSNPNYLSIRKCMTGPPLTFLFSYGLSEKRPPLATPVSDWRKCFNNWKIQITGICLLVQMMIARSSTEITYFLLIGLIHGCHGLLLKEQVKMIFLSSSLNLKSAKHECHMGFWRNKWNVL